MQPTIQHYLQEAGGCNIYSLNEDFYIIKNPTFTIVPNYLYRLEHIVVMYCCRGSAKGRVNTSIYDLSEGGFFIVLPGQITELIEQDDDFEAIYNYDTRVYIASLNRKYLRPKKYHCT